MTETSAAASADTDRSRYDALIEVVCSRMTSRAFDPGYIVPR